jgi:hypothetical protein
MAAICASCERPIAKGEHFVLSGTEVFHGRCANQIGTARSVRLELRAIELRRDLSMARDEANAARREAQTQREIAQTIARERRQADNDLRKARAVRDDAIRDARLWQARAEDLERQLVTALQAQTRLAAEIAARAQAAAAPTTAPATPDPAKDDRDASEIRFSLIELDKP